MADENTSVSSLSLFGSYLTTEYEIIKRTFSYLSFLDLKRCSEVCKSWNKLVVRLLQDRRRMQCIVIKNEKETTNLACEANLTIAFCRKLVEHSPQFEYSKSVFKVHACHGMFHLPIEGAATESRGKKGIAAKMIALRLPEWEGVFVRTFTFTKKPVTSEEFDEVLLFPNMSVKAIIILIYGNLEDVEENLAILTRLLPSYPNVALAGCCLYPHKIKETHVDMIIFGGKLNASSTLLVSEKIEEHIAELKSDVFPEKNQVLFVFRCIGRVSSLAKLEDSAISRFFPFCDVIGCYASGEYGIVSKAKNESHKRAPRINLLEPSAYTSSMLLLSFNVH